MAAASAPCTAAPLSVAPVRLEHVSNLSPIATLVPPDHVFPTPHMYFYVKNDATPNDIEVPVYAPGDMTIDSIGIRRYDNLNGKLGYTDYTLTFKFCKDLSGYFHHVRSLTHPLLVQALASQGCTPQGPATEKFCSFSTAVPLKAGEEMATTGDKEARVGGLDMGVRDYRLVTGRSAFANPDRWCGSTGESPFSQCYTVCPLDYLPEAVRSSYLELFYDYQHVSQRTDEPRCGNFYTDLRGTAQGRWYSATNNPPFTEGPHLFLGPSTFSSVVQAFSMGTSVKDLQGRRYLIKPADDGLVNRSFAEIKDTLVYCFDTFYMSDGDALRGRNPDPRLTDISILIQLTDSAKGLSVERRSGRCGAGPWQMTANAAAFVR